MSSLFLWFVYFTLDDVYKVKAVFNFQKNVSNYLFRLLTLGMWSHISEYIGVVYSFGGPTSCSSHIFFILAPTIFHCSCWHPFYCYQTNTIKALIFILQRVIDEGKTDIATYGTLKRSFKKVSQNCPKLNKIFKLPEIRWAYSDSSFWACSKIVLASFWEIFSPWHLGSLTSLICLTDLNLMNRTIG